jgi:hypothetical protein
MGHLTLRCVHCGEASQHHLNDGKAPAEHIHRFTVAVEWEEQPILASAHGQVSWGTNRNPLRIIVTRLRCESCEEEVRHA